MSECLSNEINLNIEKKNFIHKDADYDVLYNRNQLIKAKMTTVLKNYCMTHNSHAQ